MKTKRCSRCGKTLSVDAFSERRKQGGYYSECNPCKAARMREARANNPNSRQNVMKLKQSRTEKNCTMCGEYKPLGMFSRDKRNHDGRRSHCKPCSKLTAAQYYERNKTLYKNHVGKRRDVLRNADGNDFTTKQHIDSRIEYYGGKCWMCGEVGDAIDHVKPISKGGAHLPCNLRPACTACNSSKRDKWPF